MTIRKKRVILRWIGAVFLLLSSFGLAHDDVSMAGNDAARFAVIQAVGEQQVVYIENTDFRTVDKAIFNNHVYTDKPLFMSVLLGGMHRLLNIITQWNFHDNYHWLIYLFNVAVGFVMNLFLFNWMFTLLQRISHGKLVIKFLLSILMIYSTWLFSYSVMLNNHTPAALALLGLGIVLKKFHCTPTILAAITGGCSVGVATALDIPTGAIFAVAGGGGILLSSPKGKRYLYFFSYAIAVALWGVVILGINFFSYGDIRPIYILGKTFTPGVGEKSLIFYTLDTMLGSRGLLSYQPFLLLGIAGFFYFRSKLLITEKVMAMGVIATIIFYLIFTNEYGGPNYGFRYLIVIIPLLWYYGAKLVLEKKFKCKAILVTILILWGMFSSLIGAYAPFCVAYEGHRSPTKHCTRHIRSTFMGNLICYQFEKDPNSSLTRYLLDFYDPEQLYRFMQISYINLKKFEAVKKLHSYHVTEPPYRTNNP